MKSEHKCLTETCETIIAAKRKRCVVCQKAYESSVKIAYRERRTAAVIGTTRVCACGCEKEFIVTTWRHMYISGHRSHKWQETDVARIRRIERERAALKPAKAVIKYASTTISLVYPHGATKNQRADLRFDALVQASKLAGYDARHPERFIQYVEGMA